MAGKLRGTKATVYVVQDGVARSQTVSVLGEADGQLYLNPTELPPGAQVVTEGRALLESGDRVSAKQEVTP
jgi:multidrug efflux pump subunit AcrA (membrane-fusion protein)